MAANNINEVQDGIVCNAEITRLQNNKTECSKIATAAESIGPKCRRRILTYPETAVSSLERSWRSANDKKINETISYDEQGRPIRFIVGDTVSVMVT